jgi:hypothetical protein
MNRQKTTTIATCELTKLPSNRQAYKYILQPLYQTLQMVLWIKVRGYEGSRHT